MSATSAASAPAARLKRPVAIGAVAALGLLSASAGAVYGSLPSVSDAPRRVAAIGRLHAGLVVPVTPSERVARAAVAVEDERFFQHGAIDPVALGRVVVATVTRAGDPGGSTIAQQLAKTLYDEPPTLLGRLAAIGLAFKLEQRFSKPRILSMYLNAIYYGHGYWGLERASRGYFGRSARALTWGQAALLAGLPQAPSLLDPFVHPQAARQRQAVVLRQLVSQGSLTSAAAQRIGRRPVALR
jgi:membrane peptidoglycan carboxypeptidase